MTTALAIPSAEAYREQIARALGYSRGSHTVDDVLAEIDAGHCMFWPCGPESCVVTQIVEQPRKTVLHFFLAAGHMADIERATPAILAWGQAKGCTEAAMMGRRGWRRSFMARTGWQETDWIMMTLDLTPSASPDNIPAREA